ncbi:glutamyl-tRNA reductase [bacterium]|nr:glutamyl-tRNA reductase [bacterium]MBU1072862.1 glutamyl-tRNA reductase [bacterium]MBU1676317.1 glutamyl-tRNA reductase [bacterium]
MIEHVAKLFMRGVDHHLAPTEVRETAHLDNAAAGAFMDALAAEPGFVSAVPVSTCNRTELYLEVGASFRADESLSRALATAGLDPAVFFGPHARSLEGRDAVEHLYRLSSGLESMMIGEPQITGQLKDAYRFARERHELGPVVMRAFQGAFRAGKRVRTETKIGTGAVSVAFAAVELARKFFADLSRHRALLVGAGETGALASRHFLQAGIGGLTVINRSPGRSRSLADDLNQGKGELVRASPWEELGEALAAADVVLATTGSTEPVIDAAMVRAAARARRGKPLFLLDIAVPRDIHPDAAGVDGAFLFGLDDLDQIVRANLTARRKHVPAAEAIIERELDEFHGWLADVDLRPTVAEFRAYLEQLKEKQVGYVRKQESAAVAAAVERSLQQFIKKVLGRSVSTIRNSENEEERLRHLATLREIFSPGEQDRP